MTDPISSEEFEQKLRRMLTPEDKDSPLESIQLQIVALTLAGEVAASLFEQILARLDTLEGKDVRPN